MLMAVNIGNSRVGVGLYREARLRRLVFLPADPDLGVKAWELKLRPLASGPADGAIVASVNPKVGGGLVPALRRLMDAPVRVISASTPLPVRNGYQPARAAGADRLMNAVAAWEEARTAAIVVDMGTAINVDVVDRRGVFRGGAILPGWTLSAQALHQAAALLPRVGIKLPRRALGTGTAEAVRSGLVFGAVGAVMELVRRLRREVGLKTRVVLTGGNSAQASALLPTEYAWRPNLTLEGLRRTWEWIQAGRT